MTGSTQVRVTIALVLAVSLAGCGAVNVPFVDGGDGDDGRAEAIAADSVAEMQSVSSYNFTMRNVVTFDRNVVNMTADGTVNHSSERLFMDVELAIQTNTTRSKEFSRVYLLGDTRCRKVDDRTESWNVTDGNFDAWNQGLSVDSQARILNASGTEATLLANQTVNGEDAYVVRISPGRAVLKQVVANQSDVDFSNVAIQNATITQYVAQDDKRLLRSEMSVRYTFEGQENTVNVQMEYSDYGDTGAIKPPNNAKNAGCSANASA